MSKKIKLTKIEQEEINRCLVSLSSILIGQKDRGVESPSISGGVNVEGEGIRIEFDITLSKIKE